MSAAGQDGVEQSPERRALYETLQMVLAGHSVATCPAATSDSLAAAIGFAARDRAHVDVLMKLFVEDMTRTIDENWDYFRTVRASALLADQPDGFLQ